MSRRSPAAIGLIVALIGVACSDGPTGPGDGPTIQAELIRLPGTTSASSHVTLPGALLTSAAPSSYAWSSALTIDSFRSPIRGIFLSGESETAVVYECADDSNDGCLVDLAGPALQDLLSAAPVTIRAGTYDEVWISTCEDEGGYQSFLTGSVELDSIAYVTKTAGVLDTAGSAEPVEIEYSGCARTYPLPSPLVIADTAGEPVSLKLYFDIRDLAWAALGGDDTQNGWIPGGCAGPSPHDNSAAQPYLCTGYPDVAGVVDSVTPVIERYRINNGATLGLIFKGETGEFVGGFTRRYFEHGVGGNPGFSADTPVEEWADNGDGTYRLTTFGSTGPDGGPVGHYLTIEGFRRESHSGTASDYAGSQFQYAAVRLED